MYAEPYVDPTYGGPVAAPLPAATYVPTYGARSGGYATRFRPLNAIACLLATIIFAVMIATSIVCWYSYNASYEATSTNPTTGVASTFALNRTETCYDLEGASTDFFSAVVGTAHVASFKEYDSSTSVWSTMKLCRAFTLIALILSGLLMIFLLVCFADAVRNRLLFSCGMNVLRLVLLLISVIILISLVIAFLGFLGITNAFSEDNPACTAGYCKHFSDSTKENLGSTVIVNNGVTQTVQVIYQTNFGPGAGWFLTLAMIPIAIILCILVVLNKFPIPVDSVGSGEAL
jgi:hypothetical protein